MLKMDVTSPGICCDKDGYLFCLGSGSPGKCSSALHDEASAIPTQGQWLREYVPELNH